jgi:plastocyanin
MRINLFRKLGLISAVMSLALAGSAQAGSISGVIKFGGSAPKPAKKSVNKDVKVCGKNPIFDESLVVKDGGVSWAVVSIKNAPKSSKWGKLEKVVIDQKGCVYKPHVAAMKSGERLTVLNSDKILHNIHTHPGKSSNPVANIAQPKFKKKLRLSKRYFKKPGIVKVTCDVHDWMVGYVVSADHPFYAVSGGGGKFKLENVPDGSYTLEIWHEKLGKKTMKVDVKGEAKVEVALK